MRRFCATAVALALALSVNALGVNLTPVTAHDGTCDAGTFCVWQHTNWTGAEHDHWGGNSNDWNFWGMENDDDSVKNRETSGVRVYTNANYTGGMYCVLASQVEDDIHGDRDDQGDSHAAGSCSGWPSP